MKVTCPGCHGISEVVDGTAPGELVRCEHCQMQFKVPMPKASANTTAIGLTVASFIDGFIGNSAEEFEARMSDLIGAETHAVIKTRAADAFAAFMSDLEQDPAIDLERVGGAINELLIGAPSGLSDPHAAHGDAAGTPESPMSNPFLEEIRAVVREEVEAVFDGLLAFGAVTTDEPSADAAEVEPDPLEDLSAS